MEIAIAIGLGLWFTLSSVISCFMVFHDYKNKKEGD